LPISQHQAKELLKQKLVGHVKFKQKMSKSWRDKSQVLASDQLEKRKLQAQVKKNQTKNQDFYL